MTVSRRVCGGGLVAALVASGCSYAFVTPSHRDTAGPPDCTTARLAPIGDTAGAIASGGLIIMAGAAVAGSEGGVSSTSLGVVFGTTALATTLFTIAAVHGFHTTGRCRDDQAAWEREQLAGATAAPVAPHATTTATVISSDATSWNVLVDEHPVCVTPCAIAVETTKTISLRNQAVAPVLLSVRHLPGGAQVLTARPANHHVYTAAVATTIISSVGIATGLGMVIGAAAWQPPPATEEHSNADTLKSAGYGVMFGGLAGLVFSAYLFDRASANVRVTPAAGGTGAAIGFERAF